MNLILESLNVAKTYNSACQPCVVEVYPLNTDVPMHLSALSSIGSCEVVLSPEVTGRVIFEIDHALGGFKAFTEGFNVPVCGVNPKLTALVGGDSYISVGYQELLDRPVMDSSWFHQSF